MGAGDRCWSRPGRGRSLTPADRYAHHRRDGVRPDRVVVGPLVLDDVKLEPSGSSSARLAEATLAVVLFADASRITLRTLRHEAAVPGASAGDRAAADDRAWRGSGGRAVHRAERRRGARARDRAGPHRRRARPGGGDRAPAAVPDPSGPERRERAERRDLRPAAADRARGGRYRGQGLDEPARAQDRQRRDRLRDRRRGGRRSRRGRVSSRSPPAQPDHRVVAAGGAGRGGRRLPTASRSASAARVSSPRFSPERSSADGWARSPTRHPA